MTTDAKALQVCSFYHLGYVYIIYFVICALQGPIQFMYLQSHSFKATVHIYINKTFSLCIGVRVNSTHVFIYRQNNIYRQIGYNQITELLFDSFLCESHFVHMVLLTFSRFTIIYIYIYRERERERERLTIYKLAGGRTH